MKYYIEVELPDGFHWFGGIGKKTVYSEKLGKNISIPMNIWTTYKEHALPFDDKEKAQQINQQVLTDVHAVVLDETEVNFKYSYYELYPGIFIGAKRQCNLQIGDCFFRETISKHYFIAVRILDEVGKKMICKHSINGHTETFSLKSKRFINCIYDARKDRKETELKKYFEEKALQKK